MNPLLTKSYTAVGAIPRCTLVKFAGADGEIQKATDGSEAILGATVDSVDLVDGDSGDVIRAGLAFVKLGGTVTRGDPITSDANGDGISANIVAGNELYIAGFADADGVIGDIIPVMLLPCIIATATGVITLDVVISSAELLALHAVPKQLVPAPGAGKAIVLEGVQQLQMPYNSIAYNGIAAGEDLAFCYTDSAGVQLAVVETTGFLDQAASQYRTVTPLADAAKVPAANAALVLALLTGEIATGNSTMKVRIRYRTITLAF